MGCFLGMSRLDRVSKKTRMKGEWSTTDVAGKLRGTVETPIYSANVNYGLGNLTMVTKRREPRVGKKGHLGSCSHIGTITIQHV